MCLSVSLSSVCYSQLHFLVTKVNWIQPAVLLGCASTEQVASLKFLKHTHFLWDHLIHVFSEADGVVSAIRKIRG